MKVKQYNLKVFEINIDNKDEIIQFIKKNIVILEKYLVNIKGKIDNEIETILRENNILYTNNLNMKSKNGFGKRANSNRTGKLRVIDFIVRSGQEIISQSTILTLKRVNSGAFIHTDKNFIALDIVEGMVVSNGEFMLIRASSKAKIIFNGCDITDEINDKRKYKITLKDDEIEIKIYKDKG